MNKLQFIEIVNKTFPSINPNWIDLIDSYTKMIKQANQEMNLTRLDSTDKLYGQYFLESIICYKKVDFLKINSLVDVGSGSGIPGIVLKILYPHIKLTLIEASTKKANFLKKLVATLNLIDVQVINDRAEKVVRKYWQTFDLATAKAVAASPIITEILAGFIKKGGFVVLPKSKQYLQECANYELLGKQLGLKLIEIDSFVSDNEMTHNVIYFQKQNDTSSKYPRAYKDIVAKPL